MHLKHYMVINLCNYHSRLNHATLLQAVVERVIDDIGITIDLTHHRHMSGEMEFDRTYPFKSPKA